MKKITVVNRHLESWNIEVPDGFVMRKEGRIRRKDLFFSTVEYAKNGKSVFKKVTDYGYINYLVENFICIITPSRSKKNVH